MNKVNFEFDKFENLKRILNKYKNLLRIKEHAAIFVYGIAEMIYIIYIHTFGMDFIKEEAKKITNKRLKQWVDFGIEYAPSYIEESNQTFKDELEDLLQELNLEHLNDKLVELYKPYMPFIMKSDYIRFGVDKFESSDFQYYYILFILLIQDEYPEDKIACYKRKYLECKRKDLCNNYTRCKDIKICVHWNSLYYINSSNSEEYNKIIKKEAEEFKDKFNIFQQEIIDLYLECVSLKDEYKALIKLYEVFTKINQTNLFTKKLSLDCYGKEKPLTGVFSIKWDKVDFFDGYYIVWHPRVPCNKAVPFKILAPNSRKIFNRINKFFFNKLEPLYVEAKDGKIIHVLNQTNLNTCITLMEHHVMMPNLKHKNQPMLEKKEITIYEARKICHKLKSQFLDYLCSKQLADYKVICCIEHRVNATQILACEYSFIFTIKKTDEKTYLAYENSSESRCTYIFPISKDSWNESIDSLYDFFASNAVNKRQLLALRHVDLKLPGSYEYKRVFHSDYSSWVERINLV